MKENKRKKSESLSFSQLTICAVLIGLLSIIVALFAGKRVSAVFDERKAMKFSVYSQRNVIEDSVIFMGTYIIHKDALTDELYEKAEESASESGQDIRYYKSELAGGSWFDKYTVTSHIVLYIVVSKLRLLYRITAI